MSKFDGGPDYLDYGRKLSGLVAFIKRSRPWRGSLYR